jgi:hypothetical protein
MMKTNQSVYEISGFIVLLAVGLLGLPDATQAQVSAYPPLNRGHFSRVDPAQGFGDRQNSWAWSMTWYKGKLFVGTNRAQQCVNSAAIHNAIGTEPYPPTDPDISCTPDYRDLPLQAEIWSWDPVSKAWTRVYQAPADIPIPKTNPVKYVSRDQGYRGMHMFQEPDGTQALYVGSCATTVIYGNTVPPGRLLRSTDGVNFSPVPQDPGTFLGNLGNACFRGIQTYNGKLYAVATDFQGAGVLVESANPMQGNDSFRQVSPFGNKVYEFLPFNGFLYVSFSSQKGFSIYKTTATGNLPYTYKLVLPDGGHKKPSPNHDALSMKVFKGRLYVGGNGVQNSGNVKDIGAELFRINADDSWDLIVGQSRHTPDGQKNALSGLSLGFGWNLNEHMWRMEVYDGRLYVGTFDSSTVLRNKPQTGQAVQPELGADLWYTTDGTFFTAVDQQGFGDKFNFGIRSLVAVPGYGLFVGTANYYYATQIWRGKPSDPSGSILGPVGTPQVTTRPDPPAALQAESSNGRVMLSWQAPPLNARNYTVRRYTTTPSPPSAQIPDQDFLLQWLLAGFGTGISSNPEVPIASTLQVIGTTGQTVFVDSSVTPGNTYAYEVVADDGSGDQSGPSNVASFPSELPPASFLSTWTALQLYAAQGSFSTPEAQQILNSLVNQAQQAAATGNFTPLIDLWQTIVGSGNTMLNNLSAEDLATLLGRLVQRSQLVTAGLLPAGSL